MNADLAIIANDSLVLEGKMLELLKDSRLFLEKVLDYLKGKRLTKNNFRIENPEAIPQIVTTIKDIIENGKHYEHLDSILRQLRPKRTFLFHVLKAFMNEKNLIERDRRKALALYNEYLERVVWRLCESELSLARKSARRVARNITNVAYEDKMGYAYLGLVKAAHKFDFTKGVKFSTYASWWIWESILNGCNMEMYFLKIGSPMQQKYIKFLSSMRKGDNNEKQHLSEFELSEIYSSCNVTSVFDIDGNDQLDQALCDNNLDIFYKSNPEIVLKIVDSNVSRLRYVINTKLTPSERKLIVDFYGIFDTRRKSVQRLCKIFDITEQELKERLKFVQNKIKQYL